MLPVDSHWTTYCTLHKAATLHCRSASTGRERTLSSQTASDSLSLTFSLSLNPQVSRIEAAATQTALRCDSCGSDRPKDKHNHGFYVWVWGLGQRIWKLKLGEKTTLPLFFCSQSLALKASGNRHSGPEVISGLSNFHPTAYVCLCLSISNEMETGHRANHPVGGGH